MRGGNCPRPLGSGWMVEPFARTVQVRQSARLNPTARRSGKVFRYSVPDYRARLNRGAAARRRAAARELLEFLGGV